MTVLAQETSRLERVTSPAPRDVWTAVVADDPTAMADHTPAWMDALVASGPYRDASRCYEFDDGRRFVLPLARRRGVSGAVGIEASLPDGWGFGGLVGPGRDSEILAAVHADLATRRDVFTRIRPDPGDAGLWAMADTPGLVTVPRRAHVLDLRAGRDAVRAGLHRSARRNLRRAEAGELEVTSTATPAHLRAYYDLYERSLRRWAEGSHEPVALALWRGRRRDPLAKLESMATHLGDRFQLWMAWQDGEAIAGAIVLRGNCTHVTRGVMDKERARPTKAVTLLDWLAIEEAIADDSPTYHFGESGTVTSLAQYKESFGARPVDYADLRIERLPVTRIDRALRTGVKRAIGFRDGA